MYLEILKYTMFKNIVNNLNENIKNNLTYSDSLLFNLVNFTNVSNYFKLFKRCGKNYDIKEKFNNNFNNFYIDLLINVDKKNDFNKLLLIYGILVSYEVDTNIESYVNALNLDTKIDTIYNMIDVYCSKNNDLDIINNKLTDIFKDGFIYHDFIESTIHFPLIKHFKLMSSNELFLKMYKYKYKFYKHYQRKNIFYFILKIKNIFNKNRLKKSDLLYLDNVDEKILNNDNNKYVINGNELSLSLDEYINNINLVITRKINVINDYLIDNNDKKLIKEFNIDKDKKI